MKFKKEIPSIGIEQFLATNHEQWHGDGFFITNNIYPYLQQQANRISFYAIALCNGGLYRTQINAVDYSIVANSCMILKPYQAVNQIEIKDYTGMLLIFNKDFFLRSEADLHFLDSLQFFADDASPVVVLPETDARSLMDEFIMLRYRSGRQDHPYRKEIVRNLVVNFLYEIDALYQKAFPRKAKRLTHKEELVMQFQDILSRHFQEHHDVQFYADALHITPKYLSELLRNALGKNASELIYEALLTEARILLRSTALTVGQIASRLHFADTPAFAHFFRKQSGTSPLAYRKSDNN